MGNRKILTGGKTYDTASKLFTRVLTPMTQQLPPEERRSWRLRHLIPLIISAVVLTVLFFIVKAIVDKFKNPNQMDIVKSMTMDMTVRMPTGAMPITSEKVTSQSFSPSVTYTGAADAYNETPIFPRIEGWIQSLPVYAGDHVRKGQLLARLDSSEVSSKVQEAIQAHRAAEKSLLAAKSGQDEAKAHKDHFQHSIPEAEADFDYWKNEIQRAKSLVKDQVISQEEYERELAQFEAARARYHQAHAQAEAAKSAYTKSQFEVEAAQASAKRTAAAHRTQEIVRNYTDIVSPLTGVVMERFADLGILVTPTTELMRIAQIDPIRIQVNVSMEDVDKVSVGTPVRIWVDKHRSGEPITATVTSIFARTSQETRTTRIEALVPNKTGKILPGDFVTVDFLLSTDAQTLSIPNSSLLYKDQQHAVWTVKNGKAHLQYVSTGGTDGKRTRVTSGLSEGDVVITRGHADLKEGDLVVDAKYSGSRVVELPEPGTSNRLDSANNYAVKLNIEHMLVSARLSEPPPKVGVNRFTIELLPMHGELPAGISVEASSYMPAMAGMSVPKPQVKRLNDSAFEVAADLTMAGAWQLDLKILKGKQNIGDTSIVLEVSQ